LAQNYEREDIMEEFYWMSTRNPRTTASWYRTPIKRNCSKRKL